MKHIRKNNAPNDFIRWIARHNVSVINMPWKKLRGKVKRNLHHALLIEQGYICCYCERRMSANDSHIEHFRPRSSNPAKTFDYNNLLCSCQRETNQGEPLHCGKSKDNWFDSKLLISPLTPTCENKFTYTADGAIHPKNKQNRAAKTTIDKLKLDIPRLRKMREIVLDQFITDQLTAQDRKKFVTQYLQIDSSGKYPEFHTMIQYFVSKGFI